MDSAAEIPTRGSILEPPSCQEDKSDNGTDEEAGGQPCEPAWRPAVERRRVTRATVQTGKPANLTHSTSQDSRQSEAEDRDRDSPKLHADHLQFCFSESFDTILTGFQFVNSVHE